jgi:ATP-grasp domain
VRSASVFRTLANVTPDLDEFRIMTASAYAGMMAPLTDLPSSACVLSGDTDTGHQRPGVATQSLEELDGVRRRWRLGDVARLADFVPKVIARSPADHRPALLVPPRPTAAWEQASAGWPEGIVLLGRSAQEVSRIADDKVFVREQLYRIGVSVPAANVVDADEDGFPGLAAGLGAPFVLQAPQGAGGQGTYLINDEVDFAAALRGQPLVGQWLASAYAGPLTINVSGVIDADGVVGLATSIQSSGIAEIGAGFGAYCGSDFSRIGALPAEVVTAALSQTRQVGRWLHGLGHRGLFGADIAVDGHDIAFLEVNPRIQGSSWLLSKVQRAGGGEGCLIQHVRALLGQRLTDESVPAGMAVGVAGSHLMVRWTGPGGVVRSVPPAGSQPLGPGAGTVTVTGLPAVGTILLPGAIVARLESDASLTEPAGTALLPAVRRFLATLRASVDVLTRDEGGPFG